jgi:hypothetical protein
VGLPSRAHWTSLNHRAPRRPSSDCSSAGTTPLAERLREPNQPPFPTWNTSSSSPTQTLLRQASTLASISISIQDRSGSERHMNPSLLQGQPQHGERWRYRLCRRVERLPSPIDLGAELQDRVRLQNLAAPLEQIRKRHDFDRPPSSPRSPRSPSSGGTGCDSPDRRDNAINVTGCPDALSPTSLIRPRPRGGFAAAGPRTSWSGWR